MSVNCPGFKPQGPRPTKCRRCFKDVSEHNLDLGPSSTFSVYRIRRGNSRSTLELSNLGSAANLSYLNYGSNSNLNAEPSTTATSNGYSSSSSTVRSRRDRSYSNLSIDATSTNDLSNSTSTSNNLSPTSPTTTTSKIFMTRTRSTDGDNQRNYEREKTPEVTIRRKVVKPSVKEGMLLFNPVVD